LQKMQLFEGGPNSRRSRNAYFKELEANIIRHLINKYRNSEVIIYNDSYCYLEVPDLDVDLQFLRIVFGNFKKIEVGRFGFHVAYS
jgi:hypothetical protein